MVMGDLVLKDTEISAVMKRLIDGGIQISAVHNHLLRTSDPVVYRHAVGHGEPERRIRVATDTLRRDDATARGPRARVAEG
jgi:uncharacterized protein DUF1259